MYHRVERNARRLQAKRLSKVHKERGRCKLLRRFWDFFVVAEGKNIGLSAMILKKVFANQENMCTFAVRINREIF